MRRHLPLKNSPSSTYQRLETRQVLTSFLPVTATVSAAGELVLQSDSESQRTVLESIAMPKESFLFVK